MFKSVTAFFISVLVLSCCGSQDSSGQPPAFTPGGSANMVAEFKGTLKSFQRGVLLVTREDGNEVMVQPPDDPSRFLFVATAKPAFLQRGMLARFKGTFNQAGVSLSPVTRVELFQPISGKLSGHAREQYVPGVYPEGQEPNQPPQEVAQCNIVGAVTGLDPSGLMMVQAGNRPVRVQLAPDVTLEVRLNNLSLAQEGDPVSVAGFYQPPDDTKVKADQVTVTTDRVYGEPSEGPPKRTSRRRPRRTASNDVGDADKGDEGKGVDQDAEVGGEKDNAAQIGEGEGEGEGETQ